jgi:hypothetical protein
MLTEYELWLTTDQGKRLFPLSTGESLTATKLINGIGWVSLRMPSTFSPAAIKKDRMIQIWRKPVGGNNRLWEAFFVRRWEFGAEGATEYVLLEGPGLNELLRRRVMLGFAGTAEGLKTGAADDLMKAYMTESVADPASPTLSYGTRVWNYLSIKPDSSLGPTITKDAQLGTRLLERSGGGLLPDLADLAANEGVLTFFGIIPDSVGRDSLTLQFVTYINQPGKDVSSKVTFSKENLNLLNPRLTYDFSDEDNYVYSGGTGKNEARNIGQAYDTSSINSSIWGRCEGFVSATNQAGDSLDSAAQRGLEAAGPKISMVGTLVDTDKARYGVDWDTGDRVTVENRGISFTGIVWGTTLQVIGEVETIQSRIEYVSG